MSLNEPQTMQEYEARYQENFRVEGYGAEGVTNHFPCPFCAAPDWHVVRIIDFDKSTPAMRCAECGRSARIEVTRTPLETRMQLLQVDGDDPSPWVPILRDGAAPATTDGEVE